MALKAMAYFVEVSLLDVRERHSMAFTRDIRTKSHTVGGRPTLKLVERFRNRSVRELFERSIYERSFTSEPSIEKYQAKHNRVFRRGLNRGHEIRRSVLIFRKIRQSAHIFTKIRIRLLLVQ